MDQQFVYFLGAGASCEAMPLVRDFPKGLEDFQNCLRDHFKKYGTLTLDLDKSLSWLIEQSRSHQSIDTFAKKLFYKNDIENLDILKAVLSCFFVHLQFTRPVDRRYDGFLASILQKDKNNEVKIPKNIHILTWNYDTQLEKALYGFCDNSEVVLSEIFGHNKITHLNGYCGTLLNNPREPSPDFTKTLKAMDSKEAIDYVIKLYEDFLYTGSFGANIKFAWESDINETIYKLRFRLEPATVLTIIGYSFPFFNREMDRAILDSMTKLEKVYIQAPSDFISGIMERLIALRQDLRPEPREDTSSFFIPFEYG